MMSRTTGQRLDMLAHLQQSVGDILGTPIGSRTMRRNYGSLVPALLDQPDNLATQTRVFAAVASALMRWEPRLVLQKIAITRDPSRPGKATIDLTARLADSVARQGAPLNLSIPLGGSAP